MRSEKNEMKNICISHKYNNIQTYTSIKTCGIEEYNLHACDYKDTKKEFLHLHINLFYEDDVKYRDYNIKLRCIIGELKKRIIHFKMCNMCTYIDIAFDICMFCDRQMKKEMMDMYFHQFYEDLTSVQKKVAYMKIKKTTNEEIDYIMMNL